MSTTCTGILEWLSATECRIRQFDNGIVKDSNDPLVPPQISEQYSLRPGQEITATVVEKRPRRRSGRKRGAPRPVVESVLSIEGLDPEQAIECAAPAGMQSMDSALIRLMEEGKLTREQVLKHARSLERMKRQLKSGDDGEAQPGGKPR